MPQRSANLEITPERLREIIAEPLAIPRDDVVFGVEGPGAVACLQGIFTNDIVKSGPQSLLWGAMLTHKGMIVSDCWIRRSDDSALVIVPHQGVDAVVELFRRSLPPRLARVTNRADQLAVWWLTRAPSSVMEGVTVVPEGTAAPFEALAVLPRGNGAELLGTPRADGQVGDVLALLAGWPVLGREIDHRTLIQEVRFDELSGVSYDKGCYVGQETVARLHFRGHPNRTLRAITGVGTAPVAGDRVIAGDKEVGNLATVVSIGEEWVASCRLRREVGNGDQVTVAGMPAVVAEFPNATHQD